MIVGFGAPAEVRFEATEGDVATTDAQGTSRVSSEGTSRVSAEGTSRVSSEGTSRLSIESNSRVSAESTSRESAEDTCRESSEGTFMASAEGAFRADAVGALLGMHRNGQTFFLNPYSCCIASASSRIQSSVASGIGTRVCGSIDGKEHSSRR